MKHTFMNKYVNEWFASLIFFCRLTFMRSQSDTEMMTGTNQSNQRFRTMKGRVHMDLIGMCSSASCANAFRMRVDAKKDIPCSTARHFLTETLIVV